MTSRNEAAIGEGGALGKPGGDTLLVLGGARSGKSAHAQTVAEDAGARRLVFVATAQALDDEMAHRIARHRADRDERWTTCEAPIDLAGAVRGVDAADAAVLVDCLTLWVSNLLLGDHDIPAATDALIAALGSARARVVLVSNEVGWGIVPDNALARAFRDAAGTVNRRIAAAVAHVDLVVAGIPVRIK